MLHSQSNLHQYTLCQGSSCMVSRLQPAVSSAPGSSTCWITQAGCCKSACSLSTGSQD